MRVSPKIVLKVLMFMIAVLLVYLISLDILLSLFKFVYKLSFFQFYVSFEIFRHTATIISSMLAVYLFFIIVIRPVFYISSWIQLLSQGSFREPMIPSKHKKHLFLNKCAEFIYKELLIQMKILTNELKQAEEDRKRLEKNRQEWLSGITHDLKTPLSYIQGYASMISAEKYKWTYKELIDFGSKIEEKSKHIKYLIDDLNLSFESKDGKIFTNKKEVEMVEYIRNIILDIANSPDFSSYSFSFDSSVKTISIRIDSVLIQRALQNIIVNAVMHNPPETEINIFLKKVKGVLIIKIMDNGVGMSDEVQKNFFQSYYRGISTDKHSGGSGLGMAIAKRFIELHDGSIDVKSTLGHGTSIFIKLPI